MKAKLKEDPKEWRKTTLLTVLGLVIFSTLLRWRRVLPNIYWLTVLVLMSIMAITAWFWPAWYRGFYRVSTRLGFYSSQAIVRVILAILFFVILTPLSLVLRWAGKDPLQLRRIPGSRTYWHAAKETSPLDRQF